jgi:signal transduction histidine kinase
MLARLDGAELRLGRILNLLESFASRAAALPDGPAALRGDRAALSRLFLGLGDLRGTNQDSPALGISSLSPGLLAWAGSATDLGSIAPGFDKPQQVALLESVSTTLLVTSPVRDSGGSLLGVAAAELPVAVHRNIHNDFVKDFDLLQGPDTGLVVQYLDSREKAPNLEGRVLTSREGRPLAVVTANPPTPSETSEEIERPYRRALSALALFGLLAWDWGKGRRLLLAALLARGILLALGPPFPGPGSPLLSPAVYASTFLSPLYRSGLLAQVLTSLLGSPVDLFLTASLALVLGLFLAVLAESPKSPSIPRVLLGDLLTLPVLYGTFAWLADTQANSSVDVEAIPLVPRSLEQFLLQVSVLFILGAGLAFAVAVQRVAGASPSRRVLGLRILGWVAIALGAMRLQASFLEALPPLPLALAGILALVLARNPPGLASPVRRAGAALLATATTAGLLYPSLLFFETRAGRFQIDHDYAPRVLRQPQWREWVLGETRRQIDALAPSLEAPPARRAQDQAFALWSKTELAAAGSSSAVEIQDAEGRIVSRFALNLPTLDAPWKMLPEGDDWAVTKERLPLASTELPVLHAVRLLRDGDKLLGAVHVYVGDDYWNLPFVTSRDPYFELYRKTGGGSPREHNVGLHIWDPSRASLFSLAERPPSLDVSLASELAGKGLGAGVWTALSVDGNPQNAYLFRDEAGNTYALAYPRRSFSREAADLVEAVSGLTLATLVTLLLVMLARTLLGKETLTFPELFRSVRERFSLRLFVAFLVTAMVPVVVLDGVVRSFVAARLTKEGRDQAIRRADFARKAVEDAFWFQRGDTSGGSPVSDATLVWISTLVKGDLDLFEGGRLHASSQRELYASGLLSPLVPGDIYRAIALEAQPAVLRTETIGTFHFLSASVPVRLGGAEPRILSIPQALRAREAEAVLEDLDRTIRLVLSLFLLGAAALAHSMSRRISDPISELTRATRRVAEGDLEARVLPKSHDELSNLVESFNQMASDLETQRRDLEKSNRLAAWAEMARQVAHEVKNPLTPIQLSAEHLKRVYSDPGVDFPKTLEACTGTILRQVESLRGIVTEFSAFARPPAPILDDLDFKALVQTVVAPYASALPPGVSLVLEAEDTSIVRGDRRLLERAVLNLLENALQAVGERGRIALRLRTNGTRVSLEVEDSGPGIDPEIRDRIFEPFFSTKTGGSGLGLALVKKTVEDHGGGVSLESEPGRTRIGIWLPRAEGQGA